MELTIVGQAVAIEGRKQDGEQMLTGWDNHFVGMKRMTWRLFSWWGNSS